MFAGLYRLVTCVLDALKILKPETVIRWHRAGFRAYWRWKSRSRGGRQKTLLEVRQLIRDMSIENPLWGAPRIHGELLKLGIDVGQTTVASTWREEDVRHPKDGRRFFEITRTASRRWICSWSPRSRSGCCMDFWSCGIPASERAGVAVCVVACDAAGEIALLPSPWAPWKGAPLRVMLVTEKAASRRALADRARWQRGRHLAGAPWLLRRPRCPLLGPLPGANRKTIAHFETYRF